jgi:hypothetical protein
LIVCAICNYIAPSAPSTPAAGAPDTQDAQVKYVASVAVDIWKGERAGFAETILALQRRAHVLGVGVDGLEGVVAVLHRRGTAVYVGVGKKAADLFCYRDFFDAHATP